MIVAGVQMNVAIGDMATNLSKIDQFAGEAKAKGASLVAFPECAMTGYCFESKEEALQFASPVPGHHVEALQSICQKHGVSVVSGSLESEGSKLFNVALAVNAEGLQACYRKTHLPHLGVDHFATPGGDSNATEIKRGQDPYPVFEVAGVKVGLLICYDASFPEASRILMLKGADLIVLPTNWPHGAEPTADYVINARASENNIYYMSVDRVGHERGFDFIGKSKICDVYGNTIEFADHRHESMLIAEVDPSLARQKRIERAAGHWVDRVADRRPELYGRLVQSS